MEGGFSPTPSDGHDYHNTSSSGSHRRLQFMPRPTSVFFRQEQEAAYNGESGHSRSFNSHPGYGAPQETAGETSLQWRRKSMPVCPANNPNIEAEDNTVAPPRSSAAVGAGGAIQEGVVVSVFPNSAFLRPRENMAMENTSSQNRGVVVRFRPKGRSSFTGLMEPKNGDVFEFVSNGSIDRPRAFFARLTVCAPRSPLALADYLHMLLRKCHGGPRLIKETVLRSSSLAIDQHGQEEEKNGEDREDNLSSSLSLADYADMPLRKGQGDHIIQRTALHSPCLTQNQQDDEGKHQKEEEREEEDPLRSSLAYSNPAQMPLIECQGDPRPKETALQSSSPTKNEQDDEEKGGEKPKEEVEKEQQEDEAKEEEEEEEDGGEIVLREITKSPAGIQLALDQLTPSFDIVKALLDLSLALSCYSTRLCSVHVKKFHNLFTRSQFLLSPYALQKYATMESTTVEDECGDKNYQTMLLIRPFILTLAKSSSDVLPSLIPLVNKITVHGTSGDFEFLNDLLNILCFDKSALMDLPWNRISIIPSRDELRQNKTNIGRPNQFIGLSPVKKTGSYGSIQSYIDTYFRLLREDCFANLKKGMYDFQAGRLKKQDINVWLNARAIGVHFQRTTPGLTVAVRCHTSGVRKLPKQGSLLCVSCDGGKLKYPIWAIVKECVNDIANKRTAIFLVEVIEMNETEFDEVVESKSNILSSSFFQLITSSQDMILLESPAYFQAYEPVLRSLQMIDPKTLPFQEEIVHAKWPSIAPDYLTKSTSLNWECMLKVENTTMKEVRVGVYEFEKLLKEGFETMLNDSQKEAVYHVLESRLAMIQGPPGTGKTFLGSKIIELIMSADAFPKQPILIVTYKNIALDQLLENCTQFCGSLVRVGGRSSSPKLEQFNLTNLLRKANDSFKADWIQNSKRLEEIQRKMSKALEDVKSCLSVNIYSSCSWLGSGAPEQFIYKLLSQRQCDRNILNLLPKGISLSQVLVENSPMKSSDINFQLNKAIMQKMRDWMPQIGVFTRVYQCLSSVNGSIELSEEDVLSNYKAIVESESEDSDGGGDDKDEEDNNIWQINHGSEKVQINAGKADWLTSNFVNVDVEKSNMIFFDFSQEVLDSMLEQNFLFWVDPWKLSQEQRCIAVQMILKRNLEDVSRKLNGLKEEYIELCRLNKEIEKRRELEVLKNAQIIGMTTTGAAMHHDILHLISPSVVLVEEAAEILEPHIISVLNPGLQHLILIGDHYQLRPTVQCYELDKVSNLGVSMFERLVEHNKLPFKTLKLQLRMRDEFLPLLKPIYPTLESNLECVSGSRNQVPTCMKKSMFFWTHSFQETKQRSVANSGEANMVIALTTWLVAEGNEGKNITVISAYNAQVSLIRKKMKSVPGLDEVEVHTIDKYQGSENKIIIVSLVRSNEEHKIGHLNMRNRLSVAVSRARSGLYICGNAETLSSSPHWTELIGYFSSQECLGSIISLQCPRHPSNSSFPLCSNDSHSFSPTLCKQPCHAQLHDCDHICEAPCHVGDHAICKEEVKHLFQYCGHSTTRLCYESPKGLRCKENATIRIDKCGHMKICKCWELKSCKTLKCDLTCSKLLGCGHLCSLSCSDECNSKACPTCQEGERMKAEKEREMAKETINKKIEEINTGLEKLKLKEADPLSVNKLGLTGNDKWEFYMVKDRFEKYIQPDHQFYSRVTQIEVVRNLNLRKKYLEAQCKMVDPTKPSQLLFHGTSTEAIENILKEGFRLPSSERNNMYGRGIYFATDSSKSAQSIYTKGSNKLLLCEVLVGKVLCLKQPEKDLNLEKIRGKHYDSVYSERDSKATGGTLFDEYVIYDVDQAYPKYVVSFNVLSEKSSDLWHNTMGAVFMRKSLKPSEDLSANMADEFHFRTAESQFLRMLEDKKMKVTEVEVIYNQELESRYENQKKKLKAATMAGKDVKERLVFHGKTKEAIEKIIKEGFKVGGEGVPIRYGAAHGKGVYTATKPEISLHYTAGAGMMLLSLAVLSEEGEGKDYKSVGDSVYVIQNADQLLPRYIVHYI